MHRATTLTLATLTLAACGGPQRPLAHEPQSPPAATASAEPAPPGRELPVRVAQLSVSVTHACARGADGFAYCWGENSDGQVGDGSRHDRAEPARVAALGAVAEVVAGAGYSCARLEDGTVSCWGGNAQGELGDGTRTGHAAPAAIPGLTGVAQLAADELGATCARRTDGTVWCWGRGAARPAQVAGVAGAEEVTLGFGLACARSPAAGLQCWAAPGHGLVRAAGAHGPVRVAGYEAAQQVVVTRDGVCGRFADGAVRCSTQPEGEPAPMAGFAGVVSLASGTIHLCAALREGGVACAGANIHGQLGDGSRTDREAPAAVPGVRGATSVAAALGRSCAVTANGVARCWGEPFAGAEPVAEVPHRATPAQVPGVANAVALSLSRNASCARTSGGAVYCWGAAIQGLTTQDAAAPAAVSTLTGVAELRLARGYGCARAIDGTVRCWSAFPPSRGEEAGGPPPDLHADALTVGDGNACARTGNAWQCWSVSDPAGLPPPDFWRWGQLAVTTPMAVAAGGDRLCAAVHGGGLGGSGCPSSLSCWGEREDDTGAGASRERPVVHCGSFPVEEIAVDGAMGRGHGCVRLTGGEVRCWGRNALGELGDGSQQDAAEPVVVRGLANAAQVVVASTLASAHSCARTAAGEVFCWGGNDAGQLGDGTTTERATAAQVPGLSDVVDLATGTAHVCALRRDGTVWCWGRNDHGQLGTGGNS